MGTATIRAMTETYSVPHSSGRMPRLDPPPNLGLQVVLKKKSFAGYSSKKCQVSKTNEKTMPKVVRTATKDAPISMAITKLSDTLRARKATEMRDQA